MTVIELGDVTSGSDRPEPARARGGTDPRLTRRFGAALAALACMLIVGASAPPEPPRGLRTLWSIPFTYADRLTVTSDTVFTGVLNAAGELAAYTLTTGVKRWAVRLPDPTAWPTFAYPAGVVLVPNHRVAREIHASDGSTFVTEFYRETIALDAHTGAELWRRPGEVYLTDDDSVLLSDRNANGTRVEALRLVRLRDGDIVWTRAGLHVEQVTAGGADPLRPDLLLTVTPAGTVEILRLADGSRVTTGRVRWPAASAEKGVYTDVLLDGGRIYVRVGGLQGSALTGYDAETFRQLWRIDNSDSIAVYPCGTVICDIGLTAFTAHDPATGATRWRSGRTRNVWAAGPGRLLADGSRRQLIDEATGRTVADFGEDFPVQDLDGRVIYLVRNTVSPPNRTAVNRIDSGTGAVELRGAIDRVNDGGCQASGSHLVCSTLDDGLVVMRVG
jgi:outer membrane protein assembly factor BamB